ncbi:MAG: cyanophycin synthetase, partial [Oscillospiraceae bacterium]
DDIIKKVALEFAGVEHRIELAREKGGVRWYNDSIGTSPTRTIAGLRSFDKKLILIAGGYDKKISYEPLAPEIIRNVKCLLLCGATGEIIRSEVEKCSGFDNAEIAIEMKADLEECVKRANELAKSGDVVLMSPASASFDFYNNFEERGNHFKKLVKDLR